MISYYTTNYAGTKSYHMTLCLGEMLDALLLAAGVLIFLEVHYESLQFKGYEAV